MRILLVEDDLDLAEAVADALTEVGHDVDHAYDGNAGLRMAISETWDVVLLDLTLKGLDGVELCRRLRRTSDVPLLMLTARDGIDDKVTGFRAGADDYLVKPFEIDELICRIEALRRRLDGHGASAALQFAGVVLDPATRTARRGDRPLRLHRAGFALLEVLLRAAPAIARREDLERAIWGEEAPEPDRLRSHVYLLRRALDLPGEPPLLATVHGEGYRLMPDGQEGLT